MNQDVILFLLKSVKMGSAGEVFPVILAAYGEQAAVTAAAITLERDETTYSFLSDLMGSAEAERALALIWDEERVQKARGGSPEFFFYISLASYLPGEEQAHQYRIGTTVRIVKGKPDVWFHHMTSNRRFREPEACVNWDDLVPEEAAFWSLLVSKILSLSNKWFLEAAKQTNANLLVPYDLEAYE